MRSGEPTDVPPYFWTIRRMAQSARNEGEESRRMVSLMWGGCQLS
jgi:hypothetical protein